MNQMFSKAVWDRKFEAWSRPLSDTEDQQCTNAVSVVRSALSANARLASMNLSIFTQGSYVANTNVRADSDIDVCVCNLDDFFSNYGVGIEPAEVGNFDVSLTFSEYKNLIGNALLSRFAASGFTRGDKAFTLRENTYRIKADVIPTCKYRDYFRDARGIIQFRDGVKFITDSGKGITNWPKQTLENGRSKNNSTRNAYKRVVRVLKGLRNQMQNENVFEAMNIGSFLIESIAWNVADDHYFGDSLFDDVRSVLISAFNKTSNVEGCERWCEVNGIKYLFHASQPWSRAAANAFLAAVWKYVGFT